MRKKLKKNMSIDDLAVMVQRGFEETVTKSDLRHEIDGLRAELSGKIEGINRRLDAMADYNRRIARLERLVDHLCLARIKP